MWDATQDFFVGGEPAKLDGKPIYQAPRDPFAQLCDAIEGRIEPDPEISDLVRRAAEVKVAPIKLTEKQAHNVRLRCHIRRYILRELGLSIQAQGRDIEQELPTDLFRALQAWLFAVETGRPIK